MQGLNNPVSAKSEILGLMDEILSSGSSLTDLHDDLMNNNSLTDDNLNKTIISCKSMKGDLGNFLYPHIRDKGPEFAYLEISYIKSKHKIMRKIEEFNLTYLSANFG